MKTLSFCFALAALLSGCTSARPSSRHATLTAEQTRYLAKYTYLRKRATDMLGLAEHAPAEEIRPHAARFLGCVAGASWEEMLNTHFVRFWCTPERLEKFRVIFELPDDTNWIGLGLFVETLRLRVSPE